MRYFSYTYLYKECLATTINKPLTKSVLINSPGEYFKRYFKEYIYKRIAHRKIALQLRHKQCLQQQKKVSF